MGGLVLGEDVVQHWQQVDRAQARRRSWSARRRACCGRGPDRATQRVPPRRRACRRRRASLSARSARSCATWPPGPARARRRGAQRSGRRRRGGRDVAWWALSLRLRGFTRTGLRAIRSYSTATSRICPRRVIVLLIDSADSEASSTLPRRYRSTSTIVDLRQPIPGEERQQVIAQLPLVVEHGVGCPLAAVSVEPLAGELVERWVGLDVDLTRRIRRAPDASSNVGQDVCNSSSACARFHPSSVVPSVWYRRSPYAVKRSAYDVPRRVRFSTTAPVGGLGISPAAVRGNGRRQAMGPGGGCRELCQSRPAAGYCVLVRSAAAQQAGAYRCVRAEASHPRWLEGRSDVPVPPARGTSDGPSAPYPCAGRRDRASACTPIHGSSRTAWRHRRR